MQLERFYFLTRDDSSVGLWLLDALKPVKITEKSMLYIPLTHGATLVSGCTLVVIYGSTQAFSFDIIGG